ncbi:MAG: phage portal protein [Planctomycetota bacterium]
MLSPLRRVLNLDFDAVKSTGRRRPPRSRIASPDDALSPHKRKQLISTTRDLQANFPAAAWAVRHHALHASQHAFQSRTGNEQLDADLEAFMTRWSLAANCDAAGRHSLGELAYLAEQSAVCDGDVFFIRRSSKKLAAVESDRITSDVAKLPTGHDRNAWNHGIKTDADGAAQAYLLADRGKHGRPVFNRYVPAKHVIQHGFFSHLQQVRGVSPLAPAVNAFRDVYETSEMFQAKSKLSAFAGMKVKRADWGEGEGLDSAEGSGPEADAPPFKVKLVAGEPSIIPLGPEDDVSFVTADVPGGDTQAFMRLTLQIAFRALDIPFGAFSEDFTNWSGHHIALQTYRRAIRVRQQAVQSLLRRITLWRLRIAVEDGDITLPDGMIVPDLAFEWVPSVRWGWSNPLQEMKAYGQAVKDGFMSRTMVCQQLGVDFQDVADQIARENEYLRAKGISLEFPEMGPLTDPDIPAEEAA